MSQDPGEGHLRQCLAAAFGKFVQLTDLPQFLLGDMLRLEKPMWLGGTGAFRDSLEVFIRQQTLGERGERDAANPFFPQDMKQALFDPPVEHVVLRLMNQAGGPERFEDVHRLARLLRRIVGNAGVECLSAPHDLVERAHRLFEGRIRVGTVRVEDVHVLQPHALQALVDARDHVLARSPFAVRAGPHQVAGFRGDDKFIAMRGEIPLEDCSEILLGGTGGWTVVVRKVEVRDAEVERAPDHGPGVLEIIHVAKVVPESE